MISHDEIEFENMNQILNMGGPWVGDLIVEGNKIASNVFDEYLLKEDETGAVLLYFVTYSDDSKWMNENGFFVNKYNLETHELKQFKKRFEKIFLESIDSNVLTYHDAFHGENPDKRRTIELKDL